MSPPDGVAEVRRIVNMTPDIKPEPPRPLMRELPPADPFPVDALGDVLGAAARAIHDRVQAPLAIGGQSVLGAATLAVQGHADVVLPIGNGSTRPASCFFITVAATGERKTECDRQALWPIEKHEGALREAYGAELPHYENAKAAWDAAKEAAVKKGKGDRAAIENALNALGPAPAAPLQPMLTCPEPTFEGLCRLFAGGWPSLGIFASEGGQFIGGNGMSEDNKLKTAAALSSLWDGTPIKRVRVGDGVSVLPGRRLAAHLMAQPAVADVWFRDRLLADQGLMSRMLVTAPDSAAGTRFSHDERPETDHDIKRYGARLLAILELPLPLAPGKTNELRPPSLALSAPARRLWTEFDNRKEVAIRENGEYAAIRGLANKLPEHAARLAAVLTLVRDIGAGEILGDEMAAGIVLAQHYAAEALRLFGASQISADLHLAQKARDWLLHQWSEPAISLPDLYQRGPNAIREASTARKIVTKLEEHGWLIPIPQGAEIAGVRRRDAWRIVRG
jgi:Protein of unknown function (DUF3987)